MQSFQQDCADLAMRLYREGKVGRRALLAGLAALGALPRRVDAQGRQIVMVNWGGIANRAFGQFHGDPFSAANPGMRVVQDSTGPSAGRIRSMVESGRVTWDTCDSSATTAHLLGGMNMLTPIDYNTVKREDVIAPIFALEHGAAPYSFSSVLVYDSTRFPQGGPQSWADFRDLRRFPARGCCAATRRRRWTPRRWRSARIFASSTRSMCAPASPRCARSGAAASSGIPVPKRNSSSAPGRR